MVFDVDVAPNQSKRCANDTSTNSQHRHTVYCMYHTIHVQTHSYSTAQLVQTANRHTVTVLHVPQFLYNTCANT